MQEKEGKPKDGSIRAQDKSLARERGGGYGVPAYSAVPRWTHPPKESGGIRAHSKRFATFVAPEPTWPCSVGAT